MPATSPELDTDPGVPETTLCPGCGGRNRPNAAECDWCARPFLKPGERLRPSAWQLLSAVLLLVLVGAVGALAWLNMQRTLPTQRVTATPTVAATLQPTPAVTPRVITALSPTPVPSSTPRPGAATATPPPAPTPPPLKPARVANTGGAGVTVRAEPGPQARAVGTLREGAAIEVTGQEQTVAARLWREVQTPDGGVKGWALADFIQVPPP